MKKTKQEIVEYLDELGVCLLFIAVGTLGFTALVVLVYLFMAIIRWAVYFFQQGFLLP